MGFFGSLKNFFTTKEKEVVQETTSIDTIVGVKVGTSPAKPVVTIQSITQEPKKDVVEKPKPVYNNEQGVLPMAERYLVVLDTTNRPEVKDRGLQGGLKNFYFVYATQPDQAREMVLRSFARSPEILHQIQYSLTVTPMSKIIPLMNEQNYFWSYIPLNKSQRAPGQRSTPPTQRTDPNNPEVVIPMDPREIPAPATPVTQNDTPKISEIPAEARGPAAAANNPMAAFMNPTLPNGQPNPMYAMFMAMAASMQNGQPPAAPAQQQPQVSVTRGDPNNDPELAQRMAEVRATAIPRHQHHDPSAMDENMEAAERAANNEVERFKNMPKEQQAASTLKRVDMHDVGVDMEQMKKIMEASKLNQG